jgi:glycosyltransferase involved in cell wall biosynthesis
MTVREFRSKYAASPTEPAGRLAVLSSQRERLAIVSTRNKLCGIASYTHALEHHLGGLFDITVFDLDQYLLRTPHARLRRLGYRHIKEICAELKHFDAVSLQLEFGTLGCEAGDITRRLRWLVRAAPRLSVTFHTLIRPPAFPFLDLAKAAVMFRLPTAIDICGSFFYDNRLSLEVARMLRRAQRRKPVSVIVHNRRDLSDARYLHRFEQVFDHPLSFLSQAEADGVLAQTTRRQFAQLDTLPQEAKLIGVFGFLSDYKGFETVIRALHHLPDDYHLLIFGGVHPNQIERHVPIHPYIASLLNDAHVDATLYDNLHGSPTIGLNLDIERHLHDLFGKHPRDLSNRVHFMGALDDRDFLAGMAICDAVVLPYLEVGQSASGPIAQAVELGCRVIASRTHTFLEFARYHPDTVEFFDIGNHLELAERVAARRRYAARRDRLAYTVETNKAIYLAANSAPNGSVTSFPHRTRSRQRATAAS